MTKYVCGFLFSADREKVALILKRKPPWQFGQYNGIGGKIEENGEQASWAMRREFQEETGVIIDGWERFATVRGSSNKFTIYFFRAFSDDIFDVKTMEEEQVAIFNVNDLPENLIGNLSWLIPMALDRTSKEAQVSAT